VLSAATLIQAQLRVERKAENVAHQRARSFDVSVQYYAAPVRVRRYLCHLMATRLRVEAS
jgi:hypothetical protein